MKPTTKSKPTSRNFVLGCTVAGLLLVGCAQQQQRGGYHPTPAVTKAPEPQKPTAGYGPSYTTFDENGSRWIRGSMAFPTGLRESSGLLVEKTVPAEVLAGQNFDYAYKVSNLTDYPLQMVTLMDRVSPNFTGTQADPQPTGTSGGVATWQLGNLGPKETKDIHVKGSSAEEGSVTTCGWATYSPVLCEDVKVVKANIQLTKTEPSDVLICDPIPVTLVVKNNGSSSLTGVKVVDTLPDGLTSNGQGSLAFDVGNLAPGESKELKFNANAAKTGQFSNAAKATCSQGISADATASTTVHQPVLTIACKAPDERFMGRPFDVCFTVANTGDVPAAGAVAQVATPAGLTFRSATAGGQVSGNNVVWDLGSLAANAPQNVCVTFVSVSAGTFAFNGTAKGACATEVSTSCQSRVVGVAAILLEKADDPDPIGVGETTTYTVKITNQGTADDSNVKMVVTIAPELVPVSATGNGTIDGQTVTFPVVPRLAPKDAVSYQIVAKGVKAGDGHTVFKLTSDVLTSAISAEESTHVY
jgi:uncharacterized repeat protein (TIGR01451 family)